MTVFLIAVIWFWNGRYESMLQGELEERWGRKARAMVNMMRSGYFYDSQLDLMNHKLERKLAWHFNHLPPGKAPRLFPDLVRTCVERSFPSTHRPETLQIFGFRAKPEGGFEILKGRGLSTEKGKAITGLFENLASLNRFPDRIPGDLAKLKRTTKALFGEYSDPQILGVQRRSQATPATFGGKPVFVLWDLVRVKRRVRGKSGKKFREKDIGGYLLVFPRVSDMARMPLRYWVDETFRNRTCPMVPFLRPFQMNASSWPTIFPRSQGSSRHLPLPPSGNPGKAGGPVDPPPLGKKFEFHGYWMFRDFFSVDLPYEAWVVSKPFRAKSPVRHLVVAVTGLGIGFWMLFFANIAILGNPKISMRNWFLLLFGLVGGIPLVTLLLLGRAVIDQSEFRQISGRTQAAGQFIEETEAKANRTIQEFLGTVERVISRPAWIQSVFSPATARGEMAVDALNAEARRRNQPIEFVTFIRPGKVPIHRASDETRSRMNVFSKINSASSWLEKIFEDYFRPLDGPLPAFHQFSQGSREWSNILDSLTPRQKHGLFDGILETGSLAQSFGDWRVFHVGHAIGNASGEMLFGLVETNALKGFQNNLCQAVDTANLVPGTRVALGTRIPGGQKPISPVGEAGFFSTQDGKLLKAVMSRSAMTNSQELSLQGDRFFLAQPCSNLGEFILGMVVSVEEIRNQAWRLRLFLNVFAIFLFLSIVFLARRITGYLIEPLGIVEKGLQEVSGGNLSVRFPVAQEDELGLMAKAFERMVSGLKERRKLGRFVSGALERSLSNSRDSTGLPGQEKRDTSPNAGAVLVSDIRSFTTISETHSPRLVVDMLNTHLEAMSREITAGGGIIDRFIGDAVVAVFFGEQSTALGRAFDSARRMMESHKTLLESRISKGEFPYWIGIGIDYGPLIAGYLQSQGRLDFALLGNPRSNAETFEGLSKSGKHSRIIVSEKSAGVLSDRGTFTRIPGSLGWEFCGSPEKAE